MGHARDRLDRASKRLGTGFRPFGAEVWPLALGLLGFGATGALAADASAPSGFYIAPVKLIVLICLLLGWLWLVGDINTRIKNEQEKRFWNTLTFFTFGIAGLVYIAQSEQKGRGRGKGQFWPQLLAKIGLKRKRGAGAAAPVSSQDVIFLQADGLPREDQGQVGEAMEAGQTVLIDAVQKGATDIHLEPKSNGLQVRCRIDGILHNMPSYESDMAQHVVSALKVVSDLDIAERRRPQDGNFSAVVDGKTVDFRVSTAISAFGEKMVVRVLDKSKGLMTLDKLGFEGKVLSNLKRVVQMPHGMLIVSGPTGSGKTTTLYSALSELDAARKNIITIENPIEYHLPDVTQTAVNLKAGITFAATLRSTLRQDPDVLMVGEVRDKETAQIACQSALTGHFVFTTLHANDSVSSVFRLIDLGVEPFLIASSLTAVLAQRLVRRLCGECRAAYQPSAEFMQQAKKVGLPIKALYAEKGCPECNREGFRGRVGVFELLLLSDTMRDLVQENPSINQLKAEAKRSGLVLLQEDGIRKAAAGLTTLKEIQRLAT